MQRLKAIDRGSIFFAPMEGITEESYRKTIEELYPEWDYLATDFLRVPAAGRYPLKFLVKHFGEDLYRNSEMLQKTFFQILTSHKSFTLDVVSQVKELNLPWLDINLGCPSKTVCKNGGGSFLLQDLPRLRELLASIRKNFDGRLSAKVRIGYHHTNDFDEIIKIVTGEGVDLITVHGRTRDDMYSVPARWEYIARAVELSPVPVIGNGDIWDYQDASQMMEQTGCFGVMVARGALKAPWMAREFKQNLSFSHEQIINEIKSFFQSYRQNLISSGITERGLLKQSKSVSRFMFEKLPEGEKMRRELLLSQTSTEFFEKLFRLEMSH